MQAFVIEAHGGPEALRRIERPTPDPGPGEARLRILAVSLNHLDLWVRRGVPGHRFPLPIVPGSDALGRIEALGTGTRGWRIGEEALVAPGFGCGHCAQCYSGRDHLCRRYGIFGETRDGGCAEQVVVPATHLVRVPAGLTRAEASALPLTLLTAWHMLVERARVRPGETVLIHAGGSGVGVMSIQIARLFGATVLTTVGTPEKAEAARRLGAHEVILYRDTDFLDEVKRLTGRRGVDLVIDHVGADTFDRSVRALTKGGRVATCGATSGPQVQIDLRVLFFKGLTFLGSTMGGRGELEEAMRFVEDGRIRPVLDRVYRMEELPEAHRRLETREAFGKVVVTGFGIAPETIASTCTPPEALGG